MNALVRDREDRNGSRTSGRRIERPASTRSGSGITSPLTGGVKVLPAIAQKVAIAKGLMVFRSVRFRRVEA
jgi:hypothetical protein